MECAITLTEHHLKGSPILFLLNLVESSDLIAMAATGILDAHLHENSLRIRTDGIYIASTQLHRATVTEKQTTVLGYVLGSLLPQA